MRKIWQVITVFLNSIGVAVAGVNIRSPDPSPNSMTWEGAKEEATREAYEQFIRDNPSSVHVGEAFEAIVRIDLGQSAPDVFPPDDLERLKSEGAGRTLGLIY